jgi:4-hydroxyacetophenone monooxygenase
MASDARADPVGAPRTAIRPPVVPDAPRAEGRARVPAADLVGDLADAEVPALLPALAYATGDASILRPELRPDASALLDPAAGLSLQRLAEARELAAGALRSLAEGARGPGRAKRRVLRAALEYLVGEGATSRYLPLFLEELDVDGEDPRKPDRCLDEVRGRSLRVAVIGAGMSGIAAAHRLRQAGAEVVVLEKNRDVGGTWLENVYPGCRVDVPNHLYSYSFAQRRDWPQHYSTQPVLLDYFRSVAAACGVSELVRFENEVVAAAFDEAEGCWRLRVRAPEGDHGLEVDAVVSAVGQLNRPKDPEIPGRERFLGPAFHSARWDRTVELRGKRVGVIGTGASAAQIVPEVAEEAARLVVFQRTPNWLAPTPDYHDAVAPGALRLLRSVPSYAEWYRFWLFWKNAEGLLPATRVDPEFDGGGRSVSAENDLLRALLQGYLEAQFAGLPELVPHVVPDYPPAAKRIIRDNGLWAATLARDDVALVTDRIVEITPEGVRTADGREHRLDVLVYATGFHASRFLFPMRVTGRGGTDLHAHWGGDARAYLGVTVPGFPNLFCLYGPNTNIVINGSIIYFSECAVRYVVGCLRLLAERGARTLDCLPAVHDAYNEEIDAANRLMAWGASSVNSWYKNDRGRVSQNWPYSLLEYWERTTEPDPGDYAWA